MIKSYFMGVKMTEKEQKVYMINCLADIRKAINDNGGNITDETPYSQYASFIGGSSKGSFDKTTQTLTLKNAYVLEKCREIWSGEPMTYLESVLGENDVQIDTSNTTTYEGQGEFNVVSPEGFMLFSMITTAGTYSLAGSGGDGLFICTKEYPNYSSLTVLDEDFIVVTGTKGNYDVTFN